jgi:hypothetical protein
MFPHRKTFLLNPAETGNPVKKLGKPGSPSSWLTKIAHGCFAQNPHRVFLLKAEFLGDKLRKPLARRLLCLFHVHLSFLNLLL